MKKITKSQLDEAIAVLKRGGVVVFPTETSYGIAADARNDKAVRRVMEIKGREQWKTPALICASLEMSQRYVDFSKTLSSLVEASWPGPLTVVGSAKGDLSAAVVREGTVAVRVSSHEVSRALSAGIDAPIVATSANIAGKESCYRIEDAKKQFSSGLHPDVYLDVGELPVRAPSTIVTDQGGEIVVLRQGEFELPSTYVT